jgi:GNAT superfamily N-acetyltransferase
MSTLDANDGPKDHQQHIFFPPTLLPTMWSPHAKKRDVVIGTAEVSFHEFEGTKLGMSRSSGSILYVTEVAVNHSYRRQGIAKLLMQAVDKIAALRKVETVYLHVDTENRGAIQLYTDAGYKILPKDNLLFSEFTRKLNLHDGFTKGRNHHLLSKDLLQPTWHDYEVNLVETCLQTSLSSSKRIGFDVFDEHLRQTS